TSRGADVLRRLLGTTFPGILGSDRLPTYLTYAADRRQFCWAHFTRNLLSAQDLAKTTSAKRFCREALALQRRLFRLWHRFHGDPHARGAPLTRVELIAKTFPIEKKFFALGERYVNAADTDVGNLARALFVHNQHFFTSCTRRVSRRQTTSRNARCAPQCNGARSCLAIAAQMANS